MLLISPPSGQQKSGRAPASDLPPARAGALKLL
jgi:hypothetical protein